MSYTYGGGGTERGERTAIDGAVIDTHYSRPNVEEGIWAWIGRSLDNILADHNHGPRVSDIARSHVA